MATMDECLKALKGILGDIAAHEAASGLDRSLSCHLTDLHQVVLGRLSAGSVRDVRAVPEASEEPKADIRLTMSSDDLVAMTDGKLHFGKAWATGKVKLEAGLRDLLRLRKIL